MICILRVVGRNEIRIVNGLSIYTRTTRVCYFILKKARSWKSRKMASYSGHVVIFPFMSKGHTIPVLHLARLLLRRSNITVTVVTTPLNSPFIRQSLADTAVSVVDVPFPHDVPQLPDGIESTDRLPSMSLFVPFATATKLMQTDFERLLESLPRVSCIISDGFLGWTQLSATKLGIPRVVFYGMNNYAMAISVVISLDRTFARVKSDDEPVMVPGFEWVKLTKNDFEHPFNDPDATGPHAEFVNEQVATNMQSMGFLVNSFYELEAPFADFWNKNDGPRAWCVGPLCLAEPAKAQPVQKANWIGWLDEQLTRGRSVLYVAFGSQAEISPAQFEEIATGLELSEVSFLWVVRSKWSDSLQLREFEERVKDRGLVVRDWVDQVGILSHASVNGFMSHCGWNSVMESICGSVPILAWPMMAEQHLNARMVVEELGVGIRVLAVNGSVRGFVSADCVEKMVRELMEGEKGKEVRRKMKEIGQLARQAMEEGSGSSWLMLDKFLQETCT